MKAKKLFATIAAITVIMTSVSNVFAFDNYISAYRNELTYIANNISPFNAVSEDNFSYTLNDIDKDGIKELIVCTGSYRWGYIFNFYTYSSGKIISLGSMPGQKWKLFGCDGNGIFYYDADEHYESLYKIIKNENIISILPVYEYNYISPEGEYHWPKYQLTMIDGTDFTYLTLK